MKKKIGIIFGGYSSERHVSLESGRNVYEKLSSSNLYEPIPIFLSGDEQKSIKLFIVPISLLLKDNVDDILEWLKNKNVEEQRVLDFFRKKAKKNLSKEYFSTNFDIKEIIFEHLKELCDFIFIALHGIPGEDGTIQKILEDFDIPYNGSNSYVSKICMNKFTTNQILKKNGMNVADQFLVQRQEFFENQHFVIDTLKKNIEKPYIIKPLDEGCSVGIKKIEKLENLFSEIENFFSERPFCKEVLIEKFIEEEKDEKLIEVTCGFLSKVEKDKVLNQIFSPSESVAKNTILSLEEKFLAGEGQNITPCIFDEDIFLNKKMNEIFQQEMKKTIDILKIEGYARIDAFVKISKEKKMKIFIIEINTLPALTCATCIFHQAILENYSPFDFIDKIIEFGFFKKNQK
jgi:D-alanine--D-alanine ligase